MSNRNELNKARERVVEAERSLSEIEALPRHRGARIVWGNGVVWTRKGDDEWAPDAGPDDLRYSSAHVGSFLWTPVASTD